MIKNNIVTNWLNLHKDRKMEKFVSKQVMKFEKIRKSRNRFIKRKI